MAVFKYTAVTPDGQQVKSTIEGVSLTSAENDLIRQNGGSPEDGGSAMGAMHRGWVSIKSKLTSYDDKAVAEEAERGEDNAKARYAKALQKNLPANVRSVVERQYQGVQRNHDQVKQLRDQLRASS